MVAGKAKYILYEDGVYQEVPLNIGEVVKVEAGVPHVMVVEEDIITFEWWEGDFHAELCGGEFNRYVEGKVGPELFNETHDTIPQCSTPPYGGYAEKP